MSIAGAVTELNKEIERLTKIRDSLLQTSAGTSTQPPISLPAVTQKRKYVSSATTPAKSSRPAKKSAPTLVKAVSPAKRVISPATRKKMSDAAKTRAAAKTESK